MWIEKCGRSSGRCPRMEIVEEVGVGVRSTEVIVVVVGNSYLLKAEVNAGVEHHLALSIVGADLSQLVGRDGGEVLQGAADAEPGDLYAAGDGVFEFQRTVSRLEEMRSDEYLAQGHGADGETA